MKLAKRTRRLSLLLALMLVLTISAGAMDGMPPGGFGG